MEEIKKEYTVVGKVEIGTDEYRDLIVGLMKAKEEAREEYNKYWDKFNEASKLKEKNELLEKTLKSYQDFFSADEVAKERYKTFVAEQKLKELNEDGNY